MGVDQKTTLMRIEVDLQCCRCYKKIKKVLCRIPQIQDQVYNEKGNCVLIKVVCCSPEKIKQKIICQGGCAVKSIEIIEKPMEKPKPEEKPKPPPEEKPKPPPEAPQKPDKPKEIDKSKETDKPNEPEKPKGSEKHNAKPPHWPPPHCPPPPCRPPRCPPPPCRPPRCPPPPCRPPRCPPPPCRPPRCPPQLAYPEFRTCCTECSEGRVGGPCFSDHGRPPASCDGYYGRPIYDSYGGCGYRSSYVSQCDYFVEENSSGCSIM